MKNKAHNQYVCICASSSSHIYLSPIANSCNMHQGKYKRKRRAHAQNSDSINNTMPIDNQQTTNIHIAQLLIAHNKRNRMNTKRYHNKTARNIMAKVIKFTI